MPISSLNPFKTSFHLGDTRPKAGNDHAQGATSAKRAFFGRAVSTLNRVVTPELQRLKAQFRQALTKEAPVSSATILEGAVRQANSELAHLNELYTPTGYANTPGQTFPNNPDASTINEIRARLETVANSRDFSEAAPLTGMSLEKTAKLTQLIEANRHDPMFKLMGPSKFLGYALKSEENISKADPKYQACAATMTTCERVALFGYTCADYSTLNAALRKDNAGTKLQAYIDHATAGMKKCPPYTANGGVTMRSIKDPPKKEGWAPKRYKNDKTVTERAFTSTGVTTPKSTYAMVVTGRGYDVSAFSAWPAETEVLYPPGTAFKITVDPAAPNVFKAQQMAPG